MRRRPRRYGNVRANQRRVVSQGLKPFPERGVADTQRRPQLRFVEALEQQEKRGAQGRRQPRQRRALTGIVPRCSPVIGSFNDFGGTAGFARAPAASAACQEGGVAACSSVGAP